MALKEQDIVFTTTDEGVTPSFSFRLRASKMLKTPCVL